MPEVEIINPVTYPGWDDLVLSTERYSFFHSCAWARVLSESYGYKPLYFTIFDKTRLAGLIPLMELKSILTGLRGVSLPFSDYCEPMANDRNHFKALFNYIIDYGKKFGWKSIELRGGEKFFRNTFPSSYFYGHTLDLTQDEDKLLSGFRHSTRGNIKKSISGGVIVKISKSRDSVKEFYRLHCTTRRRHGLPPQPFRFFESLYSHVISKQQGIVVLASYNEKVIAGGVFFHFGEKAIFKYAAWDSAYRHLRPNNLVTWEAIKWYSESEYAAFCLGRTEPENKGLLQFKDGWTTKSRVKYYKYDLLKATFKSQGPIASQFSNIICRRLPIPALKIIGLLLYKHIG